MPGHRSGWKHHFGNAACGSADESNFKPPDRVRIPPHQLLDLKETDQPGVYIFRVVVTDQIKGTSARAERRFTYAPSGVAQGASSAEVRGSPVSTTQAASFTVGPGTGTLQGLHLSAENEYVDGGRSPMGGQASWYIFKPSGTMAVDCKTIVDPDDALGWPTQVGSTFKESKRGFQFFDCKLGRYRISGDKIQISAQLFSLDRTRRVKIRDTDWNDLFDKKGEVSTFRFVDGAKQIRIANLSFSRQGDETGRKLSGNFGYLVFGTAGTNEGHASFSADDQFSMSTDSLYAGWGANGVKVEGYKAIQPGPGAAIGPGGSTGHGHYEIQGNEITFHMADGTTTRQMFAYLGKDRAGHEMVVIGDWVWTTGLAGHG